MRKKLLELENEIYCFSVKLLKKLKHEYQLPKGVPWKDFPEIFGIFWADSVVAVPFLLIVRQMTSDN